MSSPGCDIKQGGVGKANHFLALNVNVCMHVCMFVMEVDLIGFERGNESVNDQN